MDLPAIQLPSTKGARLQITAKSFANTVRKAEEDAAVLRAEAQAGTSHPRTVADFYTRATADLAAIRAAAESEIAAIDSAVAILDGAPAAASQHPLVMTSQEMHFTASAFAKAASGLARDKAAGLIEETRNQLRACRDAAQRALTDHEHRLDAIANKAGDALRASIATYGGPYRISLKEAAALLRLDGIPDDDQPLPAPDYDPRLPGDHPARKAAVLQTICKSREAEAEMARQHHADKAARRARPKAAVDEFRAELAQLGSN